MNTQWSRILIWLFSCWMLSSTALADGYNKGLDAFKDGDYSKAYKILAGVVKKSKDKTDKAEAMALMGAAAAKMGKKGKAESLFAKALKIDSDVSLSKDAVKDKGVRKLFAKVKKGGGSDDSGGDDFDDEKSDKGDKGEKTAGRRPTGAKAFIPFGIGFFMGGETTKGLIYGASQAAGVFGFVAFGVEVNKAEADAKNVGESALANQQPNTPPDPETLDFLSKNEAFVKQARQMQTLLGALAGASYGIGILDGLFFGKKSSGTRRRVEVIHDTPRSWASNEEDTTVETQEIVEEEPRLWDMKVHLIPARDPALMFSINHSF